MIKGARKRQRWQNYCEEIAKSNRSSSCCLSVFCCVSAKRGHRQIEPNRAWMAIGDERTRANNVSGPTPTGSIKYMEISIVKKQKKEFRRATQRPHHTKKNRPAAAKKKKKSNA